MKKIILATIAATALTATFAQTQTFSNSDLVGNWQSTTCEKFEIGNQTNFLKRNFDFTLNTWQLAYTIFADPGCNVKLFTSRLVGPYTLGENAKLERTRHIIWGQTEKFFTPHLPDMVAAMNGGGCGDSKAGINVERNISVTGCLALGTPNVKDYGAEYDLLALRDGKLYTGLRRDGMNLEANRPTALFDFALQKR